MNIPLKKFLNSNILKMPIRKPLSSYIKRLVADAKGNSKSSRQINLRIGITFSALV